MIHHPLPVWNKTMKEWILKIRSASLFFIFVTAIIFTCSAAFADTNNFTENRVSLNIAWEGIHYKEFEPDNSLEARSDLSSMVIGIEGIKRWNSLFFGARVALPSLKGSSDEEVGLSGKTFQENALDIEWIRVDGFIGCPLIYWFNPYVGLRWSEIRQERNNFVVTGVPVTSQAMEELKSLSLFFGIMGAGSFSHRWMWNYRADLYLPLSVKVTNNALPGFEASDRSGHMTELKGGIDYLFTDNLAFGLLLYGGWMHWNGSQWQYFAWGRAKWPENDLYYLGVGMSVSYKF